LLERDVNIPPLKKLMREVEMIASLQQASQPPLTYQSPLKRSAAMAR
jgi:uncharacterized protein (UPF0276 family)